MKTLMNDTAPASYCAIHQHYKWCEHNGGVLGATGYEAPAAPAPEPVAWFFEDDLPGMSQDAFDAWFGLSKVIDGVRMYPLYLPAPAAPAHGAMTNDELTEAIEYASDQAYTRSGPLVALFLAQLDALLKVQQQRAKENV